MMPRTRVKHTETESKVQFSDKTHWKVEEEAYNYHGFNPYSVEDSNSKEQKGERNAGRDVYDTFTDLNFTDHLPTGLELLENSDHIYMRQPIPTSISDDPTLLEKHKNDSVYEILDQNGLRLYFVSSLGRKIDPIKRFMWYDFYGQEILVNSVKLAGCDCENNVIVSLPHDSDKIPSIGRVKQTCGCRANYKLMVGDEHKAVYKYSSLKGQLLICPQGPHRPREFNIVDPEDNDLVSKIFRINGYVDFGGHELKFGNMPTKENFDGCAIHFTNSEIGVETKAVIISSAIMLNIQFFNEKQCCGYGCRCLSGLLLALIFLILLIFGIIGCISFFVTPYTMNDSTVTNNNSKTTYERLDGRKISFKQK